MLAPSAIVTVAAISAPTNVPTNGITVRAPTSRPIGTESGIPTIVKPIAYNVARIDVTIA